MIERNITQYGDPGSSRVLIQMADDHDLEAIGAEAAEIARLAGDDFCLTAVKVRDWNHDLSPWEAPPVFGNAGFGDGAADTLDDVLGLMSDRSKTYLIGGYSLAGLFALWAAYRTKAFAAVAAASPSMWFPGFLDLMKEEQIHAGAVYLSLGDKESKTRNPVMATVGDRIREASALLEEQGVNTTLEWNPGNHFRDPGIRTAKAFAWALNAIKKVSV